MMRNRRKRGRFKRSQHGWKGAHTYGFNAAPGVRLEEEQPRGVEGEVSIS